MQALPKAGHNAPDVYLACQTLKGSAQLPGHGPQFVLEYFFKQLGIQYCTSIEGLVSMLQHMEDCEWSGIGVQPGVLIFEGHCYWV